MLKIGKSVRQSFRGGSGRVLAATAAVVWLAAVPAAAQDEEGMLEKSFQWSIEFNIGTRYSQSGIAWGNALNELVIPERRAMLEESRNVGDATYRLSLGRFFGKWEFSLAVEHYEGSVGNYGALLEFEDGGLYPKSSRCNTFCERGCAGVLDDPATPLVDENLECRRDCIENLCIPEANANEIYTDPFDLGELEEIPILFSLKRHFRLKQKLRPYLGVSVGYAAMKFSEGNVNETLFVLNPLRPCSPGDPSKGMCPPFWNDPERDSCSGAKHDFIFGDCSVGPEHAQMLNEANAAINTQYPGIWCNTDRCIIPPPTVKTSVEDGLQYATFMGVNLHLTPRWALNVNTRYLWSQEKIRVSLSHPLEGFRDESGSEEYDGLCLDHSVADPIQKTRVTNCLFYQEGDTMWLSANRFSPAGYLPEYWQFKGGEISPERWEIFMGMRVLLGRQ
ncbi:MAG: hypothetical protein JSV08_09685 [Acidobacteriota bacterium]|nr:MAG: hypothetical protein JSV08_09685 [Acidobacteriota bacterium]